MRLGRSQAAGPRPLRTSSVGGRALRASANRARPTPSWTPPAREADDEQPSPFRRLDHPVVPGLHEHRLGRNSRDLLDDQRRAGKKTAHITPAGLGCGRRSQNSQPATQASRPTRRPAPPPPSRGRPASERNEQREPRLDYGQGRPSRATSDGDVRRAASARTAAKSRPAGPCPPRAPSGGLEQQQIGVVAPRPAGRMSSPGLDAVKASGAHDDTLGDERRAAARARERGRRAGRAPRRCASQLAPGSARGGGRRVERRSDQPRATSRLVSLARSRPATERVATGTVGRCASCASSDSAGSWTRIARSSP